VPALSLTSLKREKPIFWEHEGNRAVRLGKWKLVAKGKDGPWELYDIDTDRVESHNLAEKHPDRVHELAGFWDVWAERAHVKPWPWDKADPGAPVRPNQNQNRQRNNATN